MYKTYLIESRSTKYKGDMALHYDAAGVLVGVFFSADCNWLPHHRAGMLAQLPGTDQGVAEFFRGIARDNQPAFNVSILTPTQK